MGKAFRIVLVSVSVLVGAMFDGGTLTTQGGDAL